MYDNEPLPVELIPLAMAFIILVGGIEPLRVPLSGYVDVRSICYAGVSECIVAAGVVV